MSIITAPNLFETATRMKIRFESAKGKLTIEDLWDLPMTGTTSLDTVSKLAAREVNASQEESFVTATTLASARAVQKLDILKHIIAVRKQEIYAQEQVIARTQRKRQLLDLLAEKETQALQQLSREDILKELESL